jgi:hypothetical protein
MLFVKGIWEVFTQLLSEMGRVVCPQSEMLVDLEQRT